MPRAQPALQPCWLRLAGAGWPGAGGKLSSSHLRSLRLLPGRNLRRPGRHSHGHRRHGHRLCTRSSCSDASMQRRGSRVALRAGAASAGLAEARCVSERDAEPKQCRPLALQRADVAQPEWVHPMQGSPHAVQPTQGSFHAVQPAQQPVGSTPSKACVGCKVDTCHRHSCHSSHRRRSPCSEERPHCLAVQNLGGGLLCGLSWLHRSQCSCSSDTRHEAGLWAYALTIHADMLCMLKQS